VSCLRFARSLAVDPTVSAPFKTRKFSQTSADLSSPSTSIQGVSTRIPAKTARGIFMLLASFFSSPPVLSLFSHSFFCALLCHGFLT